MFLFSFSKIALRCIHSRPLYHLFYWRQKTFWLLSFQIFAGKPECRDLLVDHYSDLIPIIRMPERIFDFPFQRVYTYVNLN